MSYVPSPLVCLPCLYACPALCLPCSCPGCQASYRGVPLAVDLALTLQARQLAVVFTPRPGPGHLEARACRCRACRCRASPVTLWHQGRARVLLASCPIIPRGPDPLLDQCPGNTPWHPALEPRSSRAALMLPSCCPRVTRLKPGRVPGPLCAICRGSRSTHKEGAAMLNPVLDLGTNSYSRYTAPAPPSWPPGGRVAGE